MATDRIAVRRKEIEGELRQKWGRAKDEARRRWERLERAEDTDGIEDDDMEEPTARSSASR